MDNPLPTDPCAFIRRDIEITQKLIDEDRVGLQHPEVLTHDDVVRLKVDLERRGALLESFLESFRRCRAENPRCRRTHAGRTVSTARHVPPAIASAERGRSPEMTTHAEQLK
ncbi:hypothetical protein Mycch_3959 [Mycolicibacterium chubuense NBB4]|uniref:Uncharacterized protein n=1 Tax=Mycolicibacterium chubuense (strain NBB4) TaxID=710421 RepID=I4BN27_MYCCN|nr:hypothetical protein [Mycolicibacterium chubuense]AFM18684.1 hypothetical protein Mycch_3959 [Mycolicibacterium chubuense NBB4]